MVGVTLGLLGGGGSILTIPILIYLFQLDPVVATAYSLFVVGTTSLTGVLLRKSGAGANWNVALLFGVPSLFSIFITRKWLIPAIPDVLITIDSFDISKRKFLLGLFALLMIITSLLMILKRGEANVKRNQPNVPLVLFLGMIIGVLTGLVGAGGGFLIIPALVFLCSLSMKEATGTSLLIIGTNSLIGFTGDLLNFSVDWSFIILVSTLAIGGIVIGNKLVKRIQGYHLRKAFGWFTLTMGTWILIKELLLH